MTMSTPGGHWNQAAYHWHHVGPPLRPCAEDIQVMEDAVARYRGNSASGSLKALLCGVTPEIANMSWPGGTELLAVERSQEMINVVWPGHGDSWRRAVVGDWFSLPLPNNSLDVVIGDGCFTVLDYPRGYHTLFAALHRVLKQDGIFIMRFFVQPTEREDLGHVFAELDAGKIRSFHALKWRLAMAVQPDTQSGVQLDAVWQAWADAAINREALISRTGWTAEAIDTIALYAGKQTHYSFPTLDEVRATVSDYFQEAMLYMPGYELGEQCPILTFRRR